MPTTHPTTFLKLFTFMWYNLALLASECVINERRPSALVGNTDTVGNITRIRGCIVEHIQCRRLCMKDFIDENSNSFVFSIMMVGGVRAKVSQVGKNLQITSRKKPSKLQLVEMEITTVNYECKLKALRQNIRSFVS